MTKKSKIFILVGGIFVVVLLGAGTFFYMQNKSLGNNESEKVNSQPSSEISTTSVNTIASSSCENFPTLIEATDNNLVTVNYPSNCFLRINVDDFSIIYPEELLSMKNGCQEKSIKAYTISTSSNAYLSIECGSSYEKEIAKTQVRITNQLDFAQIPRLKGLDNKIQPLIEPYMKNFWFPFLYEEGDFNGDGQKDYLVVLEQKYIASAVDDARNRKERKLIIIMKNDDGKYEISQEVNKLVYCGECGGASFGTPDIHFLINGNQIRITDYGGTSWRWGDRYLLQFDNEKKVWKIVFTSEDYFWINDYDRTRDYSEETYDALVDDYVAGKAKPITIRKLKSFYDLEQNSPANKQLALDNFKTFPELYDSTTYSSSTYSFVPYYVNREYINTTTYEGAYLVKDGSIVWEAPVHVNQLGPESGLEDINGDGVDEIVLVDYLDNSRCDSFIYGWENGQVTLLPVKEVEEWALDHYEWIKIDCRLQGGN